VYDIFSEILAKIQALTPDQRLQATQILATDQSDRNKLILLSILIFDPETLSLPSAEETEGGTAA
jgi:hypothetical protein